VPHELISSSANPVVKRVRALADRRTRRRENAFVVEGVAPVWQAIESGARVEVLLVAPDLLRDSPAAQLVVEQEQRGTPVARLTAELFGRISGRDGPAGLAAVVQSRLARLEDLSVGDGTVLVAVHEVANPGNLGTIVRTADALGASGVVLVGESTDPFSPQAVKASMGSLFAVPLAHEPSLDRLLDWAVATGVATVTTSARGAVPLADAVFAAPLMVVLGSERTGLPPEVLARGSTAVAIPMLGRASSLNLAVAAGIMLYEVRRQLG